MTLMERLQSDHPGQPVGVEQVYDPVYGKLSTYLRIGEIRLVIHYEKDEFERISFESSLGRDMYLQLRYRLSSFPRSRA